MTNYCRNRLTLEGAADDIAAFAKACLTKSSPVGYEGLFVLDFANILPHPNGLDQNEVKKWESDEWGIPADLVEYDQASLTDTSYTASFSSPWGAPEGVIRAVACRFPRLSLRFVGVEEGNAYCFMLDSRNGVLDAAYPELTDALIDEVDGESEIEARAACGDQWWEEPSQLKRRRVRHVRHWLDEAKLGKALAGYPRYTPPHKGFAARLPIAQAKENFAYFLDRKDTRIEALRNLLGKFGLRLAFDEATKVALDQWLYRYGGLLYVAETRPSFYTHDPVWDAARRSLNVIFDLGVYLGEFAVHETPGLSWCLDEANAPRHGSVHEGFLLPSLVSSHTSRCGNLPRNVLTEVYKFCDARCNESYFTTRGGPMHRSRPEARKFFSATLHDIHLRASGEDARPDEKG